MAKEKDDKISKALYDDYKRFLSNILNKTQNNIENYTKTKGYDFELSIAIKQFIKLKQVDFAKTLGVSANYINLLISGKRSPISDIFAKLIEEIYGYSAQWIMAGVGEKMSLPSLPAFKVKILSLSPTIHFTWRIANQVLLSYK